MVEMGIVLTHKDKKVMVTGIRYPNPLRGIEFFHFALRKSLTCLRKILLSAKDKSEPTLMRVLLYTKGCSCCLFFFFQLQSHLVEMGIAMTDKNETIRTQQEVKKSCPE